MLGSTTELCIGRARSRYYAHGDYQGAVILLETKEVLIFKNSNPKFKISFGNVKPILFIKKKVEM